MVNREQIARRMGNLNIDSIPQELKELPQWVVYRLIWNEERQKHDKIPYQITGEKAKTNDPLTWTTFDNALKSTETNRFDGIGFVFSKDDPYCGIDFDHSVNEAGEITPEVEDWVKYINSYTEFSPSGNGLHVIGKGQLPSGGRKKGNYECYDQGRFFTVTGRHLDNTPLKIEVRDDEIKRFHAEVFGEVKKETAALSPQTISLSDSEIIQKAINAQGGDKFVALWNGYINGYPSQSEADLALCSYLAFWTGKDTLHIDRLFRQSKLYRKKWDEIHGRGTYGQITIEKALKGSGNVYENRESVVRIHYNLTDLGNAERFASQHKDMLRYCHPWRKWLVWDGRRWEMDATAQAWRCAYKTVRHIYAEVENVSDKDGRECLGKHAIRSESEAKIRAMLSLAEKQEGIPVKPEELDKDRWKLNLLNGTIDLKTGELKPHSRDALITKLAPVNYDSRLVCLKWLDFLGKAMMGNRGLVTFLQRIVGYCLTGNTGEQKLFFFFGNGANGKTTFIRVLQGILGDYAIKAASELLLAKPVGAHTTDLVDLKGARLAVTIEVQDGRRLAEATTKELTGSDMITGRKMRQDNETFEPTHKIILAANHKPIVHETTMALWRRIDLVPFNYVFPENERIKDYHEILLNEEGSGIFLWALEGCLEWQRMGLSEPEEVIEATRAYRTEMDILADFIDDCFIIDSNTETGNKDLREVYAKWCNDNGQKELSAKAFSQRLEEKGFIRAKNVESKQGQRGRGWRGFELRNPLNS